MQDRLMSPQDRERAQRRRRRRDVTASYLFLAPYLLLLVMFGLFPVVYAFGLSFVDTFDYVYYGFENYDFVFSDFRVTQALMNVLTYVALWVSVMLIGVVMLALMLDSIERRKANVLRTIYFLPGAVSSSALVVLWLFLLDPAASPFQSVMQAQGWSSRADALFGIGFPGVFTLMAFFTASGGWIVVFGGSLASLPTEVIEAARIDGANRLQLATRVKLPMIWRSVVLMGILSFAAGAQIFVEPQLMALGGAQFARPDWSLNQMAFQYAFRMGDFGASAALSTLLVGSSIAIALVIVFRTAFYKLD